MMVEKASSKPLHLSVLCAIIVSGDSEHSTKLGSMADRKQFQNVPAPDPELMRLLDASRNRVVTEEELREQRVSFAFGNAPVSTSDRITKESVRAASRHISLLR